MNRIPKFHFVGVGLLSGISLLNALTPAQGAEIPNRKDIVFAEVDKIPLALDLYLPPHAASTLPLLIYVHGGAWRSGSKSDVPIMALIEKGFAMASVDYRLTPVAPFPANVHDIKAAIRYLRAHAQKLGVDPKRFAILGSSAGGHLAALVGVSDGVAELEGTVGDHDDVSSAVQAIVSFYGASNLQTILGQSTPHGLSVRVPALKLMFGGLPEEKPDLAKLASPVAHVDDTDPPLLLIHGNADPQMPVEQSRELRELYDKQGLAVRLVEIPDAVHGGDVFYDQERLDLVADFLHRHLP